MSDTEPEPTGRIFYGWIIAGVSMLTLMVSNGLVIPGITVFDGALLEAFDWSRGTLKFRDLLTFVGAGLLAPLAGALADRFGVRRLMAFGCLLLAGCLMAYSEITSAAGMYAIHTLYAVVLVTAGLVVNVMLVSHWFVARRGTAIGIALVGTSLGGVVFPKLGSAWIAEHGWRSAFQLEAAIPVVLFFVLLALVRNRPEDMGLRPLGAGAPAGTQAPTAPLSVPYARALRTGTFWALAFAAMTTFYSILATQAHLFLHLSDLGFAREKAASGVSLLFLLALVGKLTFGYLADTLHQKKVFLANLVVMLTGAVLLATLSKSLLWPAIVLFGLGWGGLYTLLQLLTVESFGLADSGKILGTITTLDAIGGGLGIWLTGVLFDRTGSYQAPFTLLAVLVFLALLAATRVDPEAVRRSKSLIPEA